MLNLFQSCLESRRSVSCARQITLCERALPFPSYDAPELENIRRSRADVTIVDDPVGSGVLKFCAGSRPATAGALDRHSISSASRSSRRPLNGRRRVARGNSIIIARQNPLRSEPDDVLVAECNAGTPPLSDAKPFASISHRAALARARLVLVTAWGVPPSL